MPVHPIGRRIRKFRIEQNLSQSGLAERLGSSRQFVSKIEHDTENPGLDTLVKLAAVFGVSLAEFVDGLEVDA